MLIMAVGVPLVNIVAANAAESGMVSGIIAAATQGLFFIYTVSPIMSMMTVYKSTCASLKRWCQSLNDQPRLLETHGLCDYLKSLAMADDALSDSVFHFSIGASLTLLVSLYRGYSFAIGKQ